MSENIVAMVPARVGSTRLKMKNLALLGDKPVIAYAIDAARDAGCFARVVVNSDSDVFRGIAKRYGAEFYQRPEALGSSTTKSDHVVHDFIQRHPCDIVVWVNPIAPLQTAGEVRAIVDDFRARQLDTLITVKDEQVHCLYGGEPLNFRLDDVFAQTQDLTPVQCFVYSIMMWRTHTFAAAFDERGYALLSGRVGYYAVGRESSILIKTEEDLRLAEHVVRTRLAGAALPVRYDPEVDRLFQRTPDNATALKRL